VLANGESFPPLRRCGPQHCSRTRRYDFQARQREVAALEALQQADLATWYASSIAPGGLRRRKLCIHIAGEHALQSTALKL
jgi:secreted Zn-dependent insulinase-like peptidase